MNAINPNNQNKILVDQPKPEEWRMPDCSQMTWQALQAMGCTPGDAGERMREFYFDPDPNAFQNFSLKGVEVVRDNKIGSANESVFDEQRREQAEFDENKRLEEQRLLEAKRQEEEFFKKKADEEKYARENRPQEEAQNARIFGMPFAIATVGLGMGLTGGALSAVGAKVGSTAEAANGSVMVASNSGGGMIAAMRSLMGMDGPGAGKDFLLKGPGQAVAFTPGVPEPTPQAPAPQSPQRQMGMGMSGPSLTPPGMGMA